MAIVLVHGAFVDSTSWDEVRTKLDELGHRAVAVRLHRGSLAADTAAVQDAVDHLDEPVVACGWSYGGMVITGLITPPGSHLVYLNALMPDEGESAMSLGSEHSGGIDALLGTDEAGDLVLGGDDLDGVLWGDAPAEAAARARASLRSQAMASFIEAPARIGWRSTASTFVIGREDRVFHPALIGHMAKRAGTVIEWDTSHSPVLSRPDLVVGLLARLDPGVAT